MIRELIMRKEKLKKGGMIHSNLSAISYCECSKEMNFPVLHMIHDNDHGGHHNI